MWRRLDARLHRALPRLRNNVVLSRERAKEQLRSYADQWSVSVRRRERLDDLAKRAHAALPAHREHLNELAKRARAALAAAHVRPDEVAALAKRARALLAAERSRRLEALREQLGAQAVRLSERVRERAGPREPPALFYRKSPLNEFVLDRMPLLHEPYEPSSLLIDLLTASNVGRQLSPHVQTIAALVGSRPDLAYERELLDHPDGGVVAVDWVRVEDDDPDDSTKPTLVIFPGLGGSSRSRSTRLLAAQALKDGMRPAIFNYRGINSDLATMKPTTSVDTSDFALTLEHAAHKYGAAPLAAVGFSMGANMLVKALAVNDVPGTFTAGISVGNAFDYVRLAKRLREPLNELLYSRTIATGLKKKVLRHPNNKKVLKPALEAIVKSKTILDLDENFSRHMYNIADVNAYYEASSSVAHINEVHDAAPVLFINSLDDPFLDPSIIPTVREKITERDNMILATTGLGGHVAYRDDWIARVVRDYVYAVQSFDQSFDHRLFR